ncbi:hypothetical protein L6452_22707 [Arctium lappa]|uniref:Uncharacterized protein n=1 Tax=Arctium lappa TaxID=4217 RepID=A0ACB9B1U0_ARCLA|nr:hypothetical protein L6452_22707 [Arctium lappa]
MKLCGTLHCCVRELSQYSNAQEKHNDSYHPSDEENPIPAVRAPLPPHSHSAKAQNADEVQDVGIPGRGELRENSEKATEEGGAIDSNVIASNLPEHGQSSQMEMEMEIPDTNASLHDVQVRNEVSNVDTESDDDTTDDGVAGKVDDLFQFSDDESKNKETST